MVTEVGGAKRELGGIAVGLSSHPANADSARIGALYVSGALFPVENFGRPRGRPTCPASVAGLALRPLGAREIFVVLRDTASTRRLL